jgi:signal transduction histidine kinase
LDTRADPILSARRSEFQQIMINLMSNAVDAMPKGGTITVVLEEEESAGRHWAKISIHDTGEGIPMEIRRRIFEPFFTTKAPGKGTGLGLSIVRDIVASNQGVLEVTSELHQGTTFVVRLPLNPPAPSTADASGEPIDLKVA